MDCNLLKAMDFVLVSGNAASWVRSKLAGNSLMFKGDSALGVAGDAANRFGLMVVDAKNAVTITPILDRLWLFILLL